MDGIYTPDLQGFGDFYFLENEPKSIKDYRGYLKYFFNTVKCQDLSTLTKKDVRKVFAERLKKSPNVGYVKDMKTALRKYYAFLNEEKDMILKENIFDIKLPSYVPKKQNFIVFEEALKMIKIAAHKATTFTRRRNLMLFLLFSTSGGRKKEILNLKLQDIDLKNKMVHFRVTKNKEPRAVPIPDITCEYIERYLKEREELAGKNCKSFLVTRNGKTPSLKMLTNIPVEFKKDFGVHFGWHDFRRGYATDLSESKTQLQDIAKLMGHKNIQTTIRHYIYIRDRTLIEAASNHPAFKIKTEKQIAEEERIENIKSTESVKAKESDIVNFNDIIKDCLFSFKG